MSVLLFFVNTIKVCAVQCCFGPHCTDIHCIQKKRSWNLKSKYLCDPQKKKSHAGLEIQTSASSVIQAIFKKPQWPLSTEVKVSAPTNTTAVQSTLIVTNVKLSVAMRTERLNGVKKNVMALLLWTPLLAALARSDWSKVCWDSGNDDNRCNTPSKLYNRPTWHYRESWHSLGNESKVCHDDSNN